MKLTNGRMASAGLTAVLFLGLFATTSRAQTQPGGANDEKVQLGLAIAPVPLKLTATNQNMVGLGSYLVNAVSDCNGCHTASPMTEYTSSPYFGQPAIINSATYLGGGQDFGTLGPNSTTHIVSRNLTPDKTGMSGGHTFAEFFQIMRTGADLDHIHPSCSSTVTTNCLPPPFQGALLQIMPWPVLQNMTVDDLTAIYEYLSAIPCLEGGPGEPPVRCH
jgi:hypothetical protein